jgi:hypothetical protein
MLGWLALGLAPVVLTGSLVLLRLLKKSVTETRDSDQFVAALEIWTPVVASKRHTPRSIKRYGNRMRYLAMLQQGEQHDDTQFDLIRRRLARMFGKGAAPPAPASINALAEHQLIALGAIYEVVGVNWKRYVGAALPSQDPGDDVLDQAVDAHKRRFSTTWPPGLDEIEVFERLLSGVRLAGDPVIVQPATAARPARKGSSAESA